MLSEKTWFDMYHIDKKNKNDNDYITGSIGSNKKGKKEHTNAYMHLEVLRIVVSSYVQIPTHFLLLNRQISCFYLPSFFAGDIPNFVGAQHKNFLGLIPSIGQRVHIKREKTEKEPN